MLMMLLKVIPVRRWVFWVNDVAEDGAGEAGAVCERVCPLLGGWLGLIGEEAG